VSEEPGSHKGRKEIAMRKTTIVFAVTALMLGSSLLPARADVTHAQGNLSFYRGGVSRSSISGTGACINPTTCVVQIFVSGREYRRFVRFCDASVETITVSSGQSRGSLQCQGGGSQYYEVTGILGTVVNSTFFEEAGSQNIFVTIHVLQNP
jgi:hypothetical protein